MLSMSPIPFAMEHAVIICIFAIGVVAFLIGRTKLHQLHQIPTIGPSFLFLSYFNAFRLLFHTKDMADDGYRRHGIFRIGLFSRWLVVVSSPSLCEEMRRAPEYVLSSSASLHEFIQGDHTLHLSTPAMREYSEVIRDLLQRFSVDPGALHDEIIKTFADSLPQTSDWTQVNMSETSRMLVSRVSSRLIVGMPLCRDMAYIATSMKLIKDTMLFACVYNLLPSFMRTLIANTFGGAERRVRDYVNFIGPQYQSQLARMANDPDWDGAEESFFSHLTANVKPEHRNPRSIAYVLIILNLTMYTSTISLIYEILTLAIRPEWAESLRSEVLEVLQSSKKMDKEALDNMKMLDSFLRESSRFNSIGMLGPTRIALADFTLSDGTIVEKGSMVTHPMVQNHHDVANYDEPDKFDPWRFCSDDDDSQKARRLQFTSTSPSFVTFGHGRSACPGRFVASLQMKMMLAQLLLDYEFKLQEPRDMSSLGKWYLTAYVPDSTAKVLFRRRDKASKS